MGGGTDRPKARTRGLGRDPRRVRRIPGDATCRPTWRIAQTRLRVATFGARCQLLGSGTRVHAPRTHHDECPHVPERPALGELNARERHWALAERLVNTGPVQTDF